MLKLIYQLDVAEFYNQKEYVECAIKRWNEINQYNKIEHNAVHAYAIQDFINFQEFSKEFASRYSNSGNYYFISIYKDNSQIKSIYIPFKKKDCPIKIELK